MNFRHSHRRNDISLDLTPLIDVVFLLLIFFLVTTTFTRNRTEKPNAIPVNLPGGASGTESSDDATVFLTVTADGHVRFNELEVTDDKILVQRLNALRQSAPETSVMLRGDAGASHGRIIEVLDKVKLSGFQKVNLVVKKSPQSATPPPPPSKEE